MNKLFLTASLLMTGMVGLLAQGLVDFSNAPWEAWTELPPPDRLVYVDRVGSMPVSDPTWTAQLWEDRGGTWVALGAAVPFFGPGLEGIIANDGFQRVVSVPAGVATMLQIRVYSATGTELPVADGTNAFQYTMYPMETTNRQFRAWPTDTLMINMRAFAVGEQPRALDIGLRMFDGIATNRIACEQPGPGGILASPLRIAKNGTNYGIVLVETNALDASRIQVKTAAGIKAWKKLP